MRRWTLSLIFCFVLCFLFTSCRTTETITEYIPVELDVASLIQPIFDTRPTYPILVENPETLSDIMQNSVAFQYAYMNWKAYAETLEAFYLSLGSSDVT